MPPDREPPSQPFWRLTFNPGDDRAPTWSADGSRVIYSAAGFDSIGTPGLLLSLPFEGGAAEQALIGVQTDSGPLRWLISPTTDSAGDRLAFAQIIQLFPEDLCGQPAFLVCEPPADTIFPQPRLASVRLRVRGFADAGPLNGPSLQIEFQGRFFDGIPHPIGVPGVWQIDYHPFQRLYGEEGTLVFRPSWSPDGTEVVFSDGLRLLIWDLASGSVEPIPGTTDGVTAAWSPTGEWIAFTRLERRGSQAHFCQHFVAGAPAVACAEQRTDHELGRRILTLVRPDGNELFELGDGEEPAWSPDGSTLFFRLDDQIWLRGLQAGDPTAVAGTEAGREPAVSPDGRKLAYARRDAGGGYSIWIASLEP